MHNTGTLDPVLRVILGLGSVKQLSLLEKFCRY